MRKQVVESVDRRTEQLGEQYFPFAVPDLTRLELLTEANREEVSEFLNCRPVHTVAMKSFLTDNGFESEFNRGRYFGYRAVEGKLEGVALIGHTTLIEAHSEEALAAFAVEAKRSEIPVYLMMSEGRVIEKFWEYYKQDGARPRHVFTEKLFETHFPFPVLDCEWNVRNATTEELHQVAEAHAEVAFIESGDNPLEKDPEGFLERCLRRIEQERCFVVFEKGKLLFKADVVAETDKVAYIEGVYVAPEMRGKGIGPKCLSKLTTRLLEKVDNVCMLSNLKFESAHRSFEKAGYRSDDCCTTIFV